MGFSWQTHWSHHPTWMLRDHVVWSVGISGPQKKGTLSYFRPFLRGIFPYIALKFAPAGIENYINSPNVTELDPCRYGPVWPVQSPSNAASFPIYKLKTNTYRLCHVHKQENTHRVCIYIYNLPKFAYLVICSFIYSYMYYNNSLTWNTVIFWDSYPNPKRHSSENSEVVPALFHHPFTHHNLASNPWKSPVFLAKPHEFPLKSYEIRRKSHENHQLS
jgi:hypothetical protein